MIIVTGGAGFIGSNLVRALNARGESDITVVDDLTDGTKFRNIADCDIADYRDHIEFIESIQLGRMPRRIRAIFHQGACSTTTEWDGRYMMRNNFEYSKELLRFCLEQGIPMIYASSASVYGGSEKFVEQPGYEKPLNVYGFSKLLFDQYVQRRLHEAGTQVAGLRYFNVYGPREQHKGQMASVAWHFRNQILADGEAKLFVGSGGYGDGEQRRDFVYVDDIVDINLWLFDNPSVCGVFNAGSGKSQTFNDVANAVIKKLGRGNIRYIEFPDNLAESYQSFTEADLSLLRKAGYEGEFRNVEQGVNAYFDALV
jgi:ADP-L-glycero-D-manno-heptose 6-epimerase